DDAGIKLKTRDVCPICRPGIATQHRLGMLPRAGMVAKIEQRHAYGAFAYERRRCVAVVCRRVAKLFRSIKRCANAPAIEMARPQTPQDSNLIVGVIEGLSDPQCVFKGCFCLWTRSLRPDQRSTQCGQ